jgi:hypothetical protein
MTVDLAAVRLTRQKVNTGIWLCAALTMAASAISGVTAFYYLQKDGWGIASGAMTALAVDVALWVVLTGDRLMEALGITAGPWARAVRWGTAIMSITLNITAAAVADIPAALKAPLILLHAFVPLVMVALAELRGEYAARLAPVERTALDIEEARQRAVDTPIVAPSERISETKPALLPPDLQRSLQPAARPTTVTPFPYRSTDAAGPGRSQPASARKAPTQLVAAQSRAQTVPAGRATPVRDAAFRWLDNHHGPSTTANTLAAAIDASPHTCKKLLGEWRKQKQEVAS